MNSPTRKAQKGFTLIEVLVSILIFSIGVLGMVAIQARAVQIENDSQDRNVAANLTNELASNMWAAHSGDVTTGNLQTFYTNVWLPEVAAALPIATGAATAPDATTGAVTISIQWKGTSRQATGSQFETYITELVIQ